MSSVGKPRDAPHWRRLPPQRTGTDSAACGVKRLSWQPVFDRHLRVRGYGNTAISGAGPHPPPEQELGQLLALLRNACHVGSKTGVAPAIQFVGVDEACLAHPGIRWNLQETASCLGDCGFVLCVHLAAETTAHGERAEHRARHLRELRRHGVRVMLNCRWLPGSEAPAELSEDTCDFVRFDFSIPSGLRMQPCPNDAPASDADTPAWLRKLASRHLVELVASGIGTHEQLCQLKDLSFDLYQGPQLLSGVELWRAPGED